MDERVTDTATLSHLGFNDWFTARLDTKKAARHAIARVLAVHKASYIIDNGQGGVFAELSGNLAYSVDSAEELPTTGDWVYADFFDDDTHAIIYGVLPRKSVLKRKTAGKLVDVQLIAANIDVAFIIQSANFNFNLRRLERYLVMVNASDIVPVVLLSKCDLISAEELTQLKDRITAIAPHTQVIGFSNRQYDNQPNEDSLQPIKERLTPRSTYCLVGSSGVGKTTLLNGLLGSEQFETKTVSKKESKGRHTTTHRELTTLTNGALLIDTPGMRELANMAVDTGVDETFTDITALTENCKFANCSHSNEKGCAILAAIENNQLSHDRYKNYLKIQRESEYNQMSYSEKRKKDKDFGKKIKTVLSQKKRW